jgi:hypothetical protein
LQICINYLERHAKIALLHCETNAAHFVSNRI